MQSIIEKLDFCIPFTIVYLKFHEIKISWYEMKNSQKHAKQSPFLVSTFLNGAFRKYSRYRLKLAIT